MADSILQQQPLVYVPQGYYKCKRCERLLLLREEPPENRYWPRETTVLHSMCPCCVAEYDLDTLNEVHRQMCSGIRFRHTVNMSMYKPKGRNRPKGGR